MRAASVCSQTLGLTQGRVYPNGGLGAQIRNKGLAESEVPGLQTKRDDGIPGEGARMGRVPDLGVLLLSRNKRGPPRAPQG